MSHNVGVIVTDDIYSYNRWDLPKKQGTRQKTSVRITTSFASNKYSYQLFHSWLSFNLKLFLVFQLFFRLEN